MPGTIVVGVDGSPASRTAVDWAARRAQRHGSDMRLVYSMPEGWAPGVGPLTPPAVETATHALEAERDRIAALRPPSTIHIAIKRGEPAAVLGELSHDAGMVVVGRDKAADAHGEGFGAVGLQIVTRSACTVAIIPRPATLGAGVVVGVDGTPEADRALRVAALEAATCGQMLTIVHAAAPAGLGSPGKPQDAPGPAGAAKEGERVLDAAVVAVAAQHPGLEVHRVLDTRHGPAEALAVAADGAGLLVVGSRGSESVKHMRPDTIGSVVLARIACPMLVTTGAAGAG